MGRKAKKHKSGHESPGSHEVLPASASTRTDAGSGRKKMKRREYEKEMRVLQGELVAMQEWVKASGARICVVFEGLDSAGKGGTIRRITERTSPRVFEAHRTAHSDGAREVTDVHPALHGALPVGR